MHTKWNNYKILFLDHKKIEKDYEKYIRFFCGLVLILLALSPVAALKGLKAEQFYQREVYQQYEKEIERMSDSIKREEIGIGQ